MPQSESQKRAKRTWLVANRRRVTLDLQPEAADQLDALGKSWGLSRPETVARAVREAADRG